MRCLAGYIADKTGKTWLITFVGYIVNLLSVPALAFVAHWPLAAALIMSERIGRAIRKPTVDSMLSYTTSTYGKGWIYAVNTALDETGATIGPLLMSLLLLFHGHYRTGYSLLLISSVLAIAALTGARMAFPTPAKFEQGEQLPSATKGFSKAFWLYMAAGACFAAGLMSYELVAFHLVKQHLVEEQWIPAFLALATGCGVIASLIFGKSYDRQPLPVLLTAVVLSAAFTPLAFSGNFLAILIAMPLWGIGYAVQDTLLKAIVADVMPKDRRNSAFGVFYTGYGVGWLIGSIVAGLLYDHSRPLMIGFAVALQIASVPLFVIAARAKKAT
jgi:predicted MFS family arabinose efflux permease